MEQLQLPLSFEDFIPENHLVRVVNPIVDSLELEPLVEQVFGRIKGCWSFRRFHLRGTDKVKIEWGLLAIAHNITKMAPEG